MPYNVPTYDTSLFSFGPGVLYLGAVGVTPTVDVGGVRSGMDVELTREVLDVLQGSPRTLEQSWVISESATLTLAGIEWNLSNLAAALGYDYPGNAGLLSLGGSMDVGSSSLKFVHQTPAGGTVEVMFWEAQGSGEVSITFGDEAHELPYEFLATQSDQNWAGEALATGQQLIKVVHYLPPAVGVPPPPPSPPGAGDLKFVEQRGVSSDGARFKWRNEVAPDHLKMEKYNNWLAQGYVFFVAETAYLDGKKVEVDWHDPGGTLSRYACFRVRDGSYDFQLLADFPGGQSAPLEKGVGILHELSLWKAFARRVDTFTCDLSTAEEDYVTVLVEREGGNVPSELRIYTLKVLDSDDTELVNFTLSPPILARFDETNYDCGFLDTPDTTADIYRTQGRGHKRYAGYDIQYYFNRPVADVIRIMSDGLSPPKRGRACMFVTVPKADILGGSILIKFLTHNNPDTAASVDYYVQVWDGYYLRSSLTDFPDDAAMATKGAGMLQEIAHETGTTGYATLDVALDLSASTQDYVTIFCIVDDQDDDHKPYMDVDWLQLENSSGELRYYCNFLGGTRYWESETTNRYWGYYTYP